MIYRDSRRKFLRATTPYRGVGEYSVASGYSGKITIATADAVTLKGPGSDTQLSSLQIVSSVENANLTIENLNVAATSGFSPIKFGSGSENKLTISGTNTFTSRSGHAVVNVGGGLTVDGDGTLNATSYTGACIGVDYVEESYADLIIQGGTINASASFGAAIGGGGGDGYEAKQSSFGNITITGGTINATSYSSAGIGAGCYSRVGDIVIKGDAVVNATSSRSAGIGLAYNYNSVLFGNLISETGSVTIYESAQVTATATEASAILSPNVELGIAVSSDQSITFHTDYDSLNKNRVTITNATADATVKINDVSYTQQYINFFNGSPIEFLSPSSSEMVMDDGYSFVLGHPFTGDIIIATVEPVYLKGYNSELQYSNVRIIATVEDIDLTIEDMNIVNDSDSVIKIGSGTDNKLSFLGTNNLVTNSTSHAAINSGDNLTLGGTGTLNVTANAGAAIGSDLGGTVGNITISGGKINATSQNSAIGTDETGTAGNISVNGDAQVTATSTDETGFSTKGTITFSGDTSTSVVSNVVVNNSNTSSELTINGKEYIGSVLSFVDGAFKIAGDYNIVEGGTYEFFDNLTGTTITISTTDAVTLKGDGKKFSETKIVAAVTGADLTIENMTVENSSGSAISFIGGKNKLTLTGENNLTASGNFAAVNAEGDLTISGDGTFNATSTGSTGLAADGAITLTGDTSTSETSTVIINNADASQFLTINETLFSGASFKFIDGEPYSVSGYTIDKGGTYQLFSNLSDITITIATTDAVTLQGGDETFSDVKIISSAENIDLTLDNVNITNKADNVIKFGSGSANKLTLSGTSNLTTTDQYSAAVHNGGGLEILGDGTLNATARYYGAAIGGNFQETAGAITISGGTINATGTWGAGIGSGMACSIGAITISGGTINATGTWSAGIGSGSNGNAGNISVSGGSVTANSSSGAAVGSGPNGNAGDISVSGGSVTANSSGGAAVGAGNGGSAGDITINGAANVTATSTDCAGIGKANDSSSAGNISIGGDAQITATSTEAAELAVSSGKAITFSGDSDTSTTCDVTINSTENSYIRINDEIYNETTMKFVDGFYFVEITSGGEYSVEYANTNFTIRTSEPVTVNGNEYKFANVKIISATENADLTIKNLGLTNTADSVIQFGGGENKLTISGENNLTVSGNFAAINSEGDLTISGDGTLNATSTGSTGLASGGAITMTGDTSTSETCSVVINNANDSTALTINGKDYANKSLKFVDGEFTITNDFTITRSETYRLDENLPGTTITIATTGRGDRAGQRLDEQRRTNCFVR